MTVETTRLPGRTRCITVTVVVEDVGGAISRADTQTLKKKVRGLSLPTVTAVMSAILASTIEHVENGGTSGGQVLPEADRVAPDCLGIVSNGTVFPFESGHREGAWASADARTS